ncbi:MAG: sugar phosphate isomerase/epimerase family protein [Candidatus Vecturithrix sp.]|jgi:sugar phosphate isomerase/epimerase|nr:sugar phosphate isomerase/epimerase family protein [Candidatus Vecturithrix sp.]
MSVLLSGFADEAAKGLREQIAIHKQFGIHSLEIRNVDGVNIGQMTDAQFEEVYRILQEEEITICGFGSAIANWARPITTDFQKDLDEFQRLIPRMKRVGTNIIRIMSYPNDGFDEGEWKKQVIHRLSILAAKAEQEGVILGHENCDGWGAQSPEHLRILLEEVNSPALQVIFDSGNPIAHGGMTEDVWAFYQAAKPWICHFHIKDGYRNEKNEVVYCYPGEGWANLKAIMGDLLKSGYRGYFSMEPHIAVQVHISSEHPEEVDVRGIYEEYCRRTIALAQDLSYTLAQEDILSMQNFV